MMHEKKAVIFDLDGVLVDTGRFHKQSWFDLAEKHGFEMSDGFFLETFGMQNDEIMPKLADKRLSEGEMREMSEWKEARYRELIQGQLELMEGVKELLLNLRDAGFEMAIGTSTPKVNLDFLLENIQIAGYFGAFVTGEEVENGKPAPDTFVRAAEKLNVPAVSCVVIEDAVPGVRAGKSSGMKVLAVTTTTDKEKLQAAGADLVVDKLSDVCEKTFMKLLELTEK